MTRPKKAIYAVALIACSTFVSIGGGPSYSAPAGQSDDLTEDPPDRGFADIPPMTWANNATILQEYSTDFGVSIDVAAERLTRYRGVAPLNRELRQLFPSIYSGIWIDHAATG